MSPERGDSGSAATELVVVAPILVVLAVAALMLGRLVLLQQQVQTAARSAVAAASIWPTAAQAQFAGASTGAYDLIQGHAPCLHPTISIDTTGLKPSGWVTATIQCTVPVGTGFLPGVPASVTVTARAVAPVELYREVA